MIVTVTANTTLDLTLFVPNFEFGKTIRATESLYSMGGKPTDASWILGTLGIPSLALGFAAGASGQKVEAMLRSRGVTTDFIQVNGETRTCVNVVVADIQQQMTITTTMMEVLPEHIVALREKYIAILDQGTVNVVTLGGTLPRGMQPDFYIDFIRLARERNIPVIFDAAEPNLSTGLQAQPNYIKPNQDELSGFVGRQVKTLEDSYQAGREILKRYNTVPVISLGGDGGLVVLSDKAYFIPPLPIQVVSATGAGDAILAGLTASIERGQPIEDGIRLGFAAAAAVCLMQGTAECRPEDVERLLPQVELIPYP
ncbi:MAG TPA: 1-phosphofructokinase family hexose kinase [Phototrophicaceae bacterium]|jgi:1-phosphofructokinase family hexose kinase|nr:1-phosphofructokinase family hexose kinase [Phototrophicaceae bacterium]